MAVRGPWGPWVGPWLLTFSVLLAASNNAHGFDDDQEVGHLADHISDMGEGFDASGLFDDQQNDQMQPHSYKGVRNYAYMHDLGHSDVVMGKENRDEYLHSSSSWKPNGMTESDQLNSVLLEIGETSEEGKEQLPLKAKQATPKVGGDHEDLSSPIFEELGDYLGDYLGNDTTSGNSTGNANFTAQTAAPTAAPTIDTFIETVPRETPAPAPSNSSSGNAPMSNSSSGNAPTTGAPTTGAPTTGAPTATPPPTAAPTMKPTSPPTVGFSRCGDNFDCSGEVTSTEPKLGMTVCEAMTCTARDCCEEPVVLTMAEKQASLLKKLRASRPSNEVPVTLDARTLAKQACSAAWAETRKQADVITTATAVREDGMEGLKEVIQAAGAAIRAKVQEVFDPAPTPSSGPNATETNVTVTNSTDRQETRSTREITQLLSSFDDFGESEKDFREIENNHLKLDKTFLQVDGTDLTLPDVGEMENNYDEESNIGDMMQTLGHMASKKMWVGVGKLCKKLDEEAEDSESAVKISGKEAMANEKEAMSTMLSQGVSSLFSSLVNSTDHMGGPPQSPPQMGETQDNVDLFSDTTFASFDDLV